MLKASLETLMHVRRSQMKSDEVQSDAKCTRKSDVSSIVGERDICNHDLENN